jgi:GRAM domain
MQTSLQPNETIVREGRANLQKGLETVGGRLYLTNQRLIFEAHKVNFQAGTTEVLLSTVRSLHPSWTKFLGFIPVFPNSLSVITHNGQEFAFVLNGRATWQIAIAAQLPATPDRRVANVFR